MDADSFKLEPGRTISHFRLEKLLGEGGMGAVYLAEDLTLSRRVAIKFMRRSMLATLPNPEVRKKVEQRFIREAKSAASINHPNIAQIYEANFETDHWYIAMEFIDGKPLDEILTKDGPMKPERALDIILQVSNGLEYAWESYKIIHRDIKPQNLMLSKRGHIKIVDLGLAKPIIESGEEELELTGAGVPVGTPYYMAPEQAAGGTVNHQTDIFALGATVYELLSGKKCFQGKTPPMIYNKQINKDYLPLTDFGVDENISNLIDNMLEPNQSERIKSYEDLIQAVDHIKKGSIDSMDLEFMETIDESKVNNSKVSSKSMYGTVITGKPTDDMQTMVDIFYPVDFKIMDRYRILKVIGRGNSGIVYHCMDTQLERECSVKAIASGREYSPQVFPRIKKNYIKMPTRKHPNLVEVYDVRVSEDGNEVFVIMELLKGKNLLQHTNSMSHMNDRITIENLAPVLNEIARALDSISKEFHIVHNDLKPVSIYINENNQIKILDYGVTYLSQEDDAHLGNPEIWKHPIANPDYMSPEIWQHKKPNMAADQYSFAVIIYEVLSHKLPFWMKELQSTIEQDEDYMLGLLEKQFNRVLSETPAVIEHIDKNQNKALLKALSKNPQQRFASCESFINQLTGQGKSNFNPLLIAVAVILIGGVALGGILLNSNKNTQAQAEQMSEECSELLIELEGRADTSKIINELESANQLLSNKDFSKASESLSTVRDEINALIDTKRASYLESLNSSKDKFSELTNKVEDLIKLQPALTALQKSIQFPTYNDEMKLTQLDDAVSRAQKAVTAYEKLIRDGQETVEDRKMALQAEISALMKSWETLEGETGTEDNKKRFLEQLNEAAKALEVNDTVNAASSKDSALEIYKSTNNMVNSRYKSSIEKMKSDYSEMKRQTKPILYFLENANNTFSLILETDKTWQKAELDKQLKIASSQIKVQMKKLASLKEQLETTAKKTFLRNINNKKIECLTIKSDIQEFADLITGYPSLENDFKNAETLFKREDYLNARNNYSQLEAKLKTMQSELDKELRSRVNNLHKQVIEISSKLERYKELNPDINLKIDEFDINFQVVRAKKTENKYRSAYSEYKRLWATGNKLVKDISILVKAIPGKNWAVPRLNIKFTWVKELKFWVGTYELTNSEYREFKPDFKNKIYQGVGSMDGDNQPVSLVSHRDAVSYCKWLNIKARENGELPKGYIYRLPTGEEWKKFATAGNTTSIYPWGNKWPPTIKINAGSKGVVKTVEPEWKDYKDDFPLTAPVEKSGMNKWGIYGVSGNVWEWTLDSEGSKRAVFGGSWNSMQKFMLKIDLAGQNFAPENAANDDIGFRIVLAPAIAN